MENISTIWEVENFTSKNDFDNENLPICAFMKYKIFEWKII